VIDKNRAESINIFFFIMYIRLD
jgi:hypothetical protein